MLVVGFKTQIRTTCPVTCNACPTEVPTGVPTRTPTELPSTLTPTTTKVPSFAPTGYPTEIPTANPTVTPTEGTVGCQDTPKEQVLEILKLRGLEIPAALKDQVECAKIHQWGAQLGVLFSSHIY